MILAGRSVSAEPLVGHSVVASDWAPPVTLETHNSKEIEGVEVACLGSGKILSRLPA